MALRDQPYIPLYVMDYLTDEKLSCCTLSTQGVYIRIMCVLHKSDHYGGILFKQIPKQNLSTNDFFAFILSRQIGIGVEDVSAAIEELLFFGVLQIGDIGGVPFLYQSRMVKDFDISLKRSKSAKKGGGNPHLVNTKKGGDAQNLFKQKSKQNPEYEYEYEYENENEIKGGAGGKNAIAQIADRQRIIPRMQKIWQEVHPHHVADDPSDFRPLGEILRRLCRLKNVECPPENEEIEKIILSLWTTIVEFSSEHAFFGRLGIKGISNNVQEILHALNGKKNANHEKRTNATRRTIKNRDYSDHA